MEVDREVVKGRCIKNQERNLSGKIVGLDQGQEAGGNWGGKCLGQGQEVGENWGGKFLGLDQA